MKKIKYFIPVFCTAILLSCSQKEAEKEAESLPLVKLEKVTVQPVDQTYDYTGTVEAYYVNNIAPSSGLRIRRILVKVGDHVRAGQTVATMDQSTYNQEKARLENLQVTYERIKNLYEVGGISKQDLDVAETNYNMQKIAVSNLVENSSLKSPISGIVAEKNYDDGDMYNNQKPVVVVQQLAPVKVLINVSEELFPRIKKDMSVDLNLDIYPDETFNGKISLIHPTINSTTHTFVAEVTIPNSNMKIRPGMFGRITISLGVEERVVVPDRAIVKQQGSNERFVFVYNSDGTVTRKVVALGRRMNDSYELLSGLEQEAQVVIAGQTRLLDGIKVDVEQ